MHLCGLRKTDEEIHQLCTETIHQSTSNLWYTERRKRLTASYFGKICKMRPSTNPANTIKALLYSTFSGNKYTDYGKDHEHNARKHFSKMIDKDVTECRFFVGKDDYCYLGASPDGLIDDDGLVESKCPYKGKDSTPETINFATLSTVNLNQKSIYTNSLENVEFLRNLIKMLVVLPIMQVVYFTMLTTI